MKVILRLGVTTWGTVLEGHSVRKAEKHCSKSSQVDNHAFCPLQVLSTILENSTCVFYYFSLEMTLVTFSFISVQWWSQSHVENTATGHCGQYFLHPMLPKDVVISEYFIRLVKKNSFLALVNVSTVHPSSHIWCCPRHLPFPRGEHK